MALGALTIVEQANSPGPVKHYRVTLVGDGAYPTGGSTGLLAKLQAAANGEALNIVSVQGCSAPGTTSELEYDHANEKLYARVRSTQAQSEVSDQSGVTYGLNITAY
jgi:hypothetical protein